MPQTPQIDPNHIFPEAQPSAVPTPVEVQTFSQENIDPFTTTQVIAPPQSAVTDPNSTVQAQITSTTEVVTQTPQAQVQYIQAPTYTTPTNNYPTPAEVTQLPQQYYNPAQDTNSDFQVVSPEQVPQQPLPNKFNQSTKGIGAWIIKRWYLLLAGVAAVGIFFVGVVVYLNQPKTPTGAFDNVTATISAPSTLPAGSPGKWKVTISNKEATSIQNINLQLHFDKSFKFSSSINPDPAETDPSGYLYKIASLDAAGKGGSDTIIQFEGTLTGQIDEDTIMKGDINYTPSILASTTNNRRAGKVTPTKTRITAPEIKVDLSSFTDVVQNGGEGEIIANITNTSERDLRDLRIRMVYPDKGSFNYLSSELADSNGDKKTNPDNGKNEWVLATLPRLKQETLRVKGNVYGQDGVKVTFRLEIDVRTTSREYQTLATTSKDISIQSQPLVVTTRIDGKDSNKTFSPGEQLTFVVAYQNQSTNTLKNVEITGFVDDTADILDYSTTAFVGGDRANVNNRSIIWQGNNVPQLVNLTPQVKGELRFTIQVKKDENFIKTNRPQNNYIITPKASAKAANLQNIDVAGDVYKATGQLQFTQEIKDMGTDPTNATKRIYRVIWTLNSRQSNVNSVVVTTKSGLPVGSWRQGTVKPEAINSQINYDKSNGQITWSPGRVPAYSGIGTNPSISISFDLQTDSNSTELFQPTQITGLDDFSSEKYTLTGPNGRS
jgi:uncharacterized repeat protein (TIGR01451 family)